MLTMNLKDEIRNELVKEDAKYLKEHLKDAKKIFSLTDSGEITSEIKSPSQKDKILIHLIGLKYAYEGDMRESSGQHYKEICKELELNKNSTRVALSNWKSKGFVKQPETSIYEINASSLDNIVTYLEEKYGE